MPDNQRGFWSGLTNYVLIPLFTLGLYGLAVFVGLKVAPTSPVQGALILNLPVVSLLITLVVQIVRGHRRTCLLLRTFGWWLWWPGGTFATLALG